MDSALKQRLIGAAVLVALAMIFLPMLLKGPDTGTDDAAQVPLQAPTAPDQEFETREVPLALPTPSTPDDGVLGMDPAPPADPNAIATVDSTGAPAPRTDFDPTVAEGDAPLQPVDPATGQPAAPTPAPATAAMPAETTPVPAATPAAPLPASTAAGRYAVNVGSFSNLANARALADKLRAQGLPVMSETVDVNGKPAMRLRVGPYAERTLAEAARLRAESVAGSAGTVIALDGSVVAAAPAAATPRPATPAPATRPAAASSVGFAVQLGALSSEADANALVARAKNAGFVAFHQRVNTDRGAVWRVRIGPEADRAAADRLRESAVAKLGTRDAMVVPHP